MLVKNLHGLAILILYLRAVTLTDLYLRSVTVLSEPGRPTNWLSNLKFDVGSHLNLFCKHFFLEHLYACIATTKKVNTRDSFSILLL